MRITNLIFILMTLVGTPMSAQIFNFSLRTNNQLLIDEALAGAFIKIEQSYELCDTIKNEHFGRDGKDYFNIVSFIGIETEQGLVFPTITLNPWTFDEDFNQYKDAYKPLVTKTKLSVLNKQNELVHQAVKSPFTGISISEHLSILSDSTQNDFGLKVDTIPGVKSGWLIWLSSNPSIAESDSIRFTSIKKEIEIPIDKGFLRIDKPEISDVVYGGIYVTPVQTSIGQLTFTLTGIMLFDEEGWILEFPFIKTPIEKKSLTPINEIPIDTKLNPIKRKRK